MIRPSTALIWIQRDQESFIDMYNLDIFSNLKNSYVISGEPLMLLRLSISSKLMLGGDRNLRSNSFALLCKSKKSVKYL